MNSAPTVGERRGKLTVISASQNKNGGWRIACKCDCGNEREFKFSDVFGKAPRYGACNIGGCRNSWRTHGFKSGRKVKPEYRVWYGMIQRCHNPNDAGYRNYGARGITVCDRWRSFENFIADMGSRPAKGFSIDRIDNSKGYEPGNCRWTTPQAQCRNTRHNRIVTANGKSQCVADWADELGVTQDFLNNRLARGWSDERAINEPKH